MSGKSRHGRRKLPRSKRKRERQGTPAAGAQQPVVAQVHKPAPPPEAPAPRVSAPSTVATLAATRYPYITAELRRIGILSGAILIILIILALVFS